MSAMAVGSTLRGSGPGLRRPKPVHRTTRPRPGRRWTGGAAADGRDAAWSRSLARESSVHRVAMADSAARARALRDLYTARELVLVNVGACFGPRRRHSAGV